MFDITNPKE